MQADEMDSQLYIYNITTTFFIFESRSFAPHLCLYCFQKLLGQVTCHLWYYWSILHFLDWLINIHFQVKSVVTNGFWVSEDSRVSLSLNCSRLVLMSVNMKLGQKTKSLQHCCYCSSWMCHRKEAETETSLHSEVTCNKIWIAGFG